MNNYISRLCVLCLTIIGICSFISCEKDTSLDTPPVNEWIYKTMEENYYWFDELPKFSSSISDPEKFFNSLLSSKDGKKGYHYSYIEEDITTKSGNTSLSHGFKFIPFLLSDRSSLVVVRLTYIVKGSPAERAGLKRGDWISHYNGVQLTEGNINEFNNFTGAMNLSIGQLRNGNFEKIGEVDIASAVEMAINPIYIDTTYLVNNKKIAYLMYNSFVPGPIDNKDETYDNQLRTVFANFASQNPEAFILDLRYNQGGLLDCAQLLATMLVDQSALDKTFCKLIFRAPKNKAEVSHKLNRSEIRNGKNLNLKKLYLITGTQTASASELIINGLRPYMDVVLIGDVTEGKNVGSNEFEDKKNHSWVLHPITCHLENADGYSDYADGFEPDFNISDTHNYNTWKELGNTDEYMLSNVISIITKGVPSAGLRSSGEGEISLRPLPHPRKSLPVIITD